MSAMRKWKPKRRRPTSLSVTPLEGRVLLTTASWVKQYLQPGDPPPSDFTAWSNQLGGDGIQDAHIVLSGLPTDKSIASIDINRYGGGDWFYNVPNHWQAALENYTPGSSTADLFFQPINNLTPDGGPGKGTDSGSQYTVNITYNDGGEQVPMTNDYTYQTLLMPSENFQVSWDGQVDGSDLTGPGVGVGPDGIQDDRLTLRSLAHPENPDSSTSYPIRYVSVVGPSGSGLAWESNLNLADYANAELVTGPGSDHLYLNPVVSTGPSTNAVAQGQTLTVTVHYIIGGVDVPDSQTVTVGATDASLATSVPAPGTVTWNVNANWVGQDPASGGGQVHVHLANLPSTIQGAELSDQNIGAQNTWGYGTLAGSSPNPLGVSQSGGTADLTFKPTRNESGATLTLRLDFGGGSVSAAQFAGGKSDPGLTVADIAGTTDSPADTAALLQDIQNGVGTIFLSGTYNLTQPLVLNHPVTITVPSGSSATLNFSQPATTPGPVSPWEYAIAIEANHVTLNGFQIGFAGPTRWDWAASFGPSVIKSVNGNYLSDGVTNLVVEGPIQDVFDGSDSSSGNPPFYNNGTTAATSALNLITMVNVGSGQITGNTLTGGQIEVSGGPWNISNNVYHGTRANTTTQAFLALYNAVSDLTVLNNRVSQDDPAGKTFRFFNFGGAFASGANDVFQGNVIVGGPGMGRHSGDLAWNGGGYGLPNAPEFMLAEGFLPMYEGTPAGVSADGRVLKLNSEAMLGPPAATGDFVAIVSGPSTIVGHWYRIAQAIDATTYLMDQALPRGSYVIALAHGYSNLTIGGTGPGQGNTIDIRGSDSTDFNLGGYEFGTRVVGNHFLGGGDSIGSTDGFNIGSAVTQNLQGIPFPWGWTHTPEFGIAVDNNTFEDLVAPGRMRVDHSTNPQWWNNFIKSNAGRVYYTGSFNNNTFKYSNPTGSPIAGAIIGSNTVDVNGNPKAADPGELVLTASGNTTQVPNSYTGEVDIQVAEGTVNGRTTARPIRLNRT